MKIAISCDHVLSRNLDLEITEIVGNLYPEAEVYTLAHAPGQVLGTLEHRKVHSSFLSHKVKKLDELGKYAFTLGGASKNLFIPCSVDLIINISRGLSHGISNCETTHQLTYLVDDYWLTRDPGTIREKFFRSYLKSFSKKSLQSIESLWVGSKAILDSLGVEREASVVVPCLDLNDFKVIKSPTFKYDVLLVLLPVEKRSMAQEVWQFVNELGVDFRFIGDDEHLSEFKKSHENKFLGNRCAGELAPFMAASLGLLDFTRAGFSSFAAKSLSAGRPVFTLKGGSGHYFSSPGLFERENLGELKDEILKVCGNKDVVNGEELHDSVKKHHNVRFKTKLTKFVSDIEKKKAADA